MARDDSQLKLRLTDDLKGRVESAADQANQSMNALIVSVLEREFPHPTIDLRELAAFLSGLASEADEQGEGGEYWSKVNAGLAAAKHPWCARYDGLGVVTFYPYADKVPPGA